VRYNVKSADDNFEIYDVVADPKQTRNLALDRASATLQRKLQETALQSRRPDSTAPRPYDAVLVPALATTVTATGVDWRAYAGPFPWVPDFAALTPVATGTMSRPDPAGVPPSAAAGLLFTGRLIIPADGEYTFYLTTYTGAILRLHAATLIDADFGYAHGTEKSASIRLRSGPHPFRLSLLQEGVHAPALLLEWSGPGFARQPIPARAFVRVPAAAAHR
jgi:hypothetical protein